MKTGTLDRVCFINGQQIKTACEIYQQAVFVRKS